MPGWELPPHNSGGLGTACLGMTEALAPLGISIDFMLPKINPDQNFSHMQVRGPVHPLLPLENSFSALPGYLPAGSPSQGFPNPANPRTSPTAQANWYAKAAAELAAQSDFDLVHTHDWMTYPAGIAARQVAAMRGQTTPLLAHIHATELDRCGEQGHPEIVALEAAGLQQADRVVAVSHYTKQTVHKTYGVPLAKIEVVHNGIPGERPVPRYPVSNLKKQGPVILFLGRLTRQKGPDWFIRLAAAVCKIHPKATFVMVGSGDMEATLVEQAARAGLAGRLLFSSFLRGADVDRAYQMADLFVMPSVSEPFGIVALEAVQNGTPVLASKQSGVCEVLPTALPVDFWDTELMTKTVLNLLAKPKERQKLQQQSQLILPQLTWKQSAQKLHQLYQQLLLQPRYAH